MLYFWNAKTEEKLLLISKSRATLFEQINMTPHGALAFTFNDKMDVCSIDHSILRRLQ